MSDFIYYDRKADPDGLPRGEIERMVKAGEVSIDSIVARFRAELEMKL